MHSSRLLRAVFEKDEPRVAMSKRETTTGLACLLRSVGFVVSGRDSVHDKLKSAPLYAWLHALCRSDDTVSTLARRVSDFRAETFCVHVTKDACKVLQRYGWGEDALVIFAENRKNWARRCSRFTLMCLQHYCAEIGGALSSIMQLSTYEAEFDTTVWRGVTEEVVFRKSLASYVQVTFQWSSMGSSSAATPGVIVLSGSSNTLPQWRSISPNENVALMSWVGQWDERHTAVAAVVRWLFHDVFNRNCGFLCISRGVALFIDFVRLEGSRLWNSKPKVIWIAGSYSERSSLLYVHPADQTPHTLSCSLEIDEARRSMVAKCISLVVYSETDETVSSDGKIVKTATGKEIWEYRPLVGVVFHRNTFAEIVVENLFSHGQLCDDMAAHYWAQVRDGILVSPTVDFGMNEIAVAKLFSWTRTLHLVGPRTKALAPSFVPRRRHFFHSGHCTLEPPFPVAEDAGRELEKASSAASLRKKFLIVIGLPGSGKTSIWQPQLTLRLHEIHSWAGRGSRMCTVVASIQPMVVNCFEAPEYLRTEKNFPWVGTYTGTGPKDSLTSGLRLQFCSGGAFLARLLDCLHSDVSATFLRELRAICVDELQEAVHQNYDYVFLLSIFAHMLWANTWPASLRLVAFTGCDISDMPDLKELMQILDLHGDTMSLRGEQRPTIQKPIPAEVSQMSLQGQIEYCLDEEVRCCLREGIMASALCFVRGEPECIMLSKVARQRFSVLLGPQCREGDDFLVLSCYNVAAGGADPSICLQALRRQDLHVCVFCVDTLGVGVSPVVTCLILTNEQNFRNKWGALQAFQPTSFGKRQKLGRASRCKLRSSDAAPYVARIYDLQTSTSEFKIGMSPLAQQMWILRCAYLHMAVHCPLREQGVGLWRHEEILDAPSITVLRDKGVLLPDGTLNAFWQKRIVGCTDWRLDGFLGAASSLNLLYWSSILVAALEAVHDIYQRDNSECANHPLSETQRRHGIWCSDSLSLMAGYYKYKMGLSDLSELGWSAPAFAKWERALATLRDREEKNGLIIPSAPELNLREAAPGVIFLLAYFFQENLAYRVGRKYVTKAGLEVRISSRSITHDHVEHGEALVALSYGRGQDGDKPWATAVQVSFVTKAMWVLLENTENIGPVIDKASDVQLIVQSARSNVQKAMPHLMEDASVAQWLQSVLGMHLLPLCSTENLQLPDLGSESHPSTVLPSVELIGEDDDLKNAKDTELASESGCSADVGAKVTHMDLVLECAPAPLDPEVFCPEAQAIADLEIEWVRTVPVAIPDPSNSRFGKRLKDEDMNFLKDLQKREQAYLHAIVHVSMPVARRAASHHFERRLRMVLENGSRWTLPEREMGLVQGVHCLGVARSGNTTGKKRGTAPDFTGDRYWMRRHVDGIGILSFTEFVEIHLESGKNLCTIAEEWLQCRPVVQHTGRSNLKHHEVLDMSGVGVDHGAAGNRRKRRFIWTRVMDGRLPTTEELRSLHAQHEHVVL